ncbi:unnamed protein product [Protopolystoma xenopodis]|uniref:Uncharacterized protein n=1 Tax=Protopolystoma xenopodis TaxID=117903 RepID=A0A3S5A6T2_9PLAT|nr:unnamed protein product [Protopolystoma xenopodis]
MDDRLSITSQADTATRCHIFPLNLLKVVVAISMTMALCSMFFGMFSFGWSAWILMEPAIASPNQVFGIRRTVGAIYLCLDEPTTNPCMFTFIHVSYASHVHKYRLISIIKVIVDYYQVDVGTSTPYRLEDRDFKGTINTDL